MTLIKKRDVEAHFAARRRNPNQIHVVPAISPDTKSLPATEPEQAPVEANSLQFNKDFTADHSSKGTPLAPVPPRKLAR